MKSVKMFTPKAWLTAALMVIVVLFGCKTTDKAAKDISLKSTAKVETVEHKGTALGITDIPQWLAVFIQGNGTRSVEELPAYKGK